MSRDLTRRLERLEACEGHEVFDPARHAARIAACDAWADATEAEREAMPYPLPPVAPRRLRLVSHAQVRAIVEGP